MTPPLPQLAILIVNWRSKDYVRRCLETVRDTGAALRLQIIVVDGASFDGCAEMLRDEFPEVEFVQSQENCGFGGANNLGCQRVVAPAVLLLNPDTELRAGTLHVLLQELERFPKAGLLGPRLLNTDGSLQTSCVQALPTPWNQAIDSEFLRRLLPNSPRWGTRDAFRATETVEVEAVSGACMLLRTATFREVGGFSPEFFMYAEDMDLCAKVRRLGLSVVHVPGAVVTHHGGGSSQSQPSQFSTVMVRIALHTYMRLNHGPVTAAAFRVSQAASALLRLTLLGLVRTLLPSRRTPATAGSVLKWRYILNWALGRATIAPPARPFHRPTGVPAEPVPSRLHATR